MTLWRFFDYVRANGENPFDDWLSKQDQSVRDAYDATLYYRRVMQDWVNPLQKSARKQFEILTKRAADAGLAELRFFPDDGRTFRSFGLYQPDERRRFINLVGCEEMYRGLYYKPLNALKLAREYKRDHEQSPDRLVERVIK
jgi:hypothetical protein